MIRSGPSGVSDELDRWRMALLNPFNPKVAGVRIPDPYSYPTSSFRTEGTMSISSDSGGMASVMLIPHPYLSMINMNTNSTITTSMKRYTSSTATYAAAPRAVLGDKLSNFRLVSVGYEIRNLIN